MDVKIAVNLDPTKIKNVAILQTVVYSIQDTINADIKTTFFNQFFFPDGF